MPKNKTILQILQDGAGQANDLQILHEFSDRCIEENEQGERYWKTPPVLVNAIRSLLNYYEETHAYNRENKKATLEWLKDKATGIWGDLGADEATRNEAHQKLGAVYEFISCLESMGDGADEFRWCGLDKTRVVNNKGRIINFGDPVKEPVATEEQPVEEQATDA